MRDPGSSDRLRIGAVPYGVGAPLVTGLADRDDVALISDVPTRLIERLRAGRLDAALVSSIEGFRRPGYRAVAGVGICCRGAVRSVRAFRRRGAPIRTVGADASSAASVALLQILLEQEDYALERVAPTLEPDALPHDVVLLIGDHGVAAEPGAREVLDLGELWLRRTGLPFVFALWLIAPSAPADRVARLLRLAREAGRRHETTERGAVHYDLGEAELAGLDRFRAEAVRLGLANPHTTPKFVASTSGEVGRQHVP